MWTKRLLAGITLGLCLTGTAQARFNDLGVGARAMGMGRAFVAVANDATAMFWNAAGMTQLKSL